MCRSCCAPSAWSSSAGAAARASSAAETAWRTPVRYCWAMPQAKAATILHADLDAFYASVEQLLDPTLRGRPIAVGGGVVLAASYEARRFGVSGGMSGWQARRLCPSLQFVGGHFREYSRLSDQVMEILR